MLLPGGPKVPPRMPKGPPRATFWTIFGVPWHPLGTIWDHFWITFTTFWIHFGVRIHFGTLWVYFSIFLPQKGAAVAAIAPPPARPLSWNRLQHQRVHVFKLCSHTASADLPCCIQPNKNTSFRSILAQVLGHGGDYRGGTNQPDLVIW